MTATAFPAAGRSALDFSDSELAELNAEFERSTPRSIISWAVESFHPQLTIAVSMTDAVLIDMAVEVEPSIEVAFIDTGYHFPETLQTLEQVRRRYALNLRIMTAPEPEVELWKVDPANCCSALKVAQLDRALMGKQAWMSGLRRSETPERAGAPIVARDKRGLIKVNPLATWSDLDVQGYIEDHQVPVNPLVAQGYLSIGCAPCTQPATDGADPRSGRWPGLDKTECGLHL